MGRSSPGERIGKCVGKGKMMMTLTMLMVLMNLLMSEKAVSAGGRQLGFDE